MLLQERMSRLFEDATERRARGEAHGDSDDLETVDWFPASDVYDTDTAYLIAVDLPGVDRSALEIDIDEKRLVIRGTRELEKRGVNAKDFSRPHGRFRRSFTVPANVAQDDIKAEYRNGVLEVRLPKRSEPSGKRIQIKVD
jgi:HSP20 family protein